MPVATIDQELRAEVEREIEEDELDVNQRRLLNEFKRVRSIERDLGNVPTADLL